MFLELKRRQAENARRFSAKIDGILNESNPREVIRMIYNLELTLAEMQQQALLKGKMEDRLPDLARKR
ncbi:hypothetical protein SEF58_00520 [Neomoorella humiferrea]|uniref:hypothetical protein n=1 Tax=Neomoorella humiferrea TaxID=676965 RepID=UPI003D8D41BD